jgi:uncharacterized protein (UPF0333 family)
VSFSGEAIAGLIGIASAYVLGEGFVDGKAVQAAAAEAKSEALQNLTLYARTLEQQLSELMQPSQTGTDPSLFAAPGE